MLFFFTAAYSLSAVPVDLLHCEFNRTPESEISYSGNPVKVSRTSGGWHLTFPKIGRTEAFQLPHSYWKRPRPEAVVLRAEALKGRAFVKMNLVEDVLILSAVDFDVGAARGRRYRHSQTKTLDAL